MEKESTWAKLCDEIDFDHSGDITSSWRQRFAHEKELYDWLVTRLISEEAIIDGVNEYINSSPSGYLAKMVFQGLRPPSAMIHCKNIFDNAKNYSVRKRRAAIQLLGEISDERVLNWIDEFISDDDLEIQLWGALIVPKLILHQQIDGNQTAEFVNKFSVHPNPKVKERAVEIREILDEGLT